MWASTKMLLPIAACTGILLGPAQADPRLDSARQSLPEPARKALEQIPDPGRQLLAMRSYLRSAATLEKRWSWTKAETDAYLKSDTYVTSMAAVAAVVKAFEIRNPGYTLMVNTDVRSLDEQIEKWNTNPSVGAAGAEISGAAHGWLKDRPKAGPSEIKAFLGGWKPATTPTIAAPGLSLHGRALAFDFQVSKDGKVIAGADTGAIAAQWQAGGWNARLAEAVRLSAMPFEGPLQNPDEPWHYDYNPPVLAKPKAPVDVATAEPAQATPEPSNPEVASPPAVAPVPVAKPQQNAAANPPAAKPREVRQREVKPHRASAKKAQKAGPRAKRKARPARKRR